MVKIILVMSTALLLGIGSTATEERTSLPMTVVSERALPQEMESDTLEEVLETLSENMGLTSQIHILDLQYTEGRLLVDLSKELIAYGGGNAAEEWVIEALLDWGFDTVGADSMTLLVEGSIEGFPEGRQIQQYTKECYEDNFK